MRVVVAAILASALRIAHGDALRTIDDAFPPTIRVDSPSNFVVLQRVTLERGSEVTWLTLRLAARARSRETEVAIDLPQGTRVIGIALMRDQGSPREKTAWGRSIPAAHRYKLFHDAAAAALLEHAGVSGDVEHLVLRVAKIATAPAEVTLGLELPVSRIVIDARTTLVIDGKRTTNPATVSVTPGTRVDDATHVDSNTSLLAEMRFPETPIVAPVVPRVSSCTFGGGLLSIRKAVHLHLAALRHCYMRVAQTQPDLEGQVLMRFFIQRDGSVASVSVEGGAVAASSVGPCLVHEVGTWVFPVETDGGGTQVNYPLDFRLRR
jgi:hypothetical protein